MTWCTIACGPIAEEEFDRIRESDWPVARPADVEGTRQETQPLCLSAA